MSGLIKINDEEVEILIKNNSGDFVYCLIIKVVMDGNITCKQSYSPYF